VDDNALIRESFRAGVDRYPDWEICAEAENGLDGIAKAQELHPDVIVLDLSMPVRGRDGGEQTVADHTRDRIQ
jgi:DNA-binding NarL/FixJ family response regulator